jgi:hypothetical protein
VFFGRFSIPRLQHFEPSPAPLFETHGEIL